MKLTDTIDTLISFSQRWRHPFNGITRMSTKMWIAHLSVVTVLILGPCINEGKLSVHSAMAQNEQPLASTEEALAHAQELLSHANQLEGEKKYQEAFDLAGKAISTLAGITGLARMPTRLYRQGQGYMLLGIILARVDQLEDAKEAWNTAMRYFDLLYKSDTSFWKHAAQPGSGFEQAASNIATTLDFLSQVNEALKLPDEAIRYLYAESSFYEKLGQDEQALQTLHRILPILEENPQLPNNIQRQARTLTDIAIVMVNAGQTAESLDVLRKADQILSSLPNSNHPELAIDRAELKLRTGYALQANGRHEEAVAILSRAATEFASLKGQTKSQLIALERLFVSMYMLERFPQAADTLREQIEIMRKNAGFEGKEYEARSRLMLVYHNMGAYDLARQEFEVMREIAGRVEIPVKDRVQAFKNMGVIHQANGAHKEALESFNTVIHLLEDVAGTELQQAKYQIDIAIALTALKQPEKARKHLEHGLKLLETDHGAEAKIVVARLRQSIAEDDEQRLGKKGAHFLECQHIATDLARVAGADNIVLTCLVDIGTELQRKGRFKEAINTFQKALDRLPPSTPTGVTGGLFASDSTKTQTRGKVLTRLGVASIAAGQYTEATAHLVAAANVGRDRFLNTLMGMTILERYRYMESPRIQRFAANLSVSLAFQSQDADTALAFETAVSIKNLFTEVSRWQREVLNRARDPELKALIKHYINLRQRVAQYVINWQRGGPDEANVDSDIVEALFKNIRELEHTIIRQTQAGLEGMAEKNNLAKRITSSLGRDQVLLEFVRFMPLNMKAVRSFDLEALKPDDSKTYHYGVFVISANRNVIAVDLGSSARIDALVLEYRRIHQNQSAPATFNLNETALTAAADPLRQLLFDPLTPYLRNVKRLYVASEGQLSLIPFEALPSSTHSGYTRYLVEDYEIVYLTTGRDLLRRKKPARSPHSREVWLIGDPDFNARQSEMNVAANTALQKPALVENSEGTLVASTQQMGAGDRDNLRNWPRLERTLNLLDTVSVAARAAGMKPVTLTGAAASEANIVKMQAPRLVVFATHGKFLDQAPKIVFSLTSLSFGPEGSKIEGLSVDEMLGADPLFRSMLVLAGANRSAQPAPSEDADPGDGLLTAYEVWGLDLNGTELVALTACETGLGVVQSANGSTGLRQPTGEVVAGLRQAFLVAGAQSVVMSMWPVPLGETVHLLENFFNGWLGAGGGRYTSFHQSQINALRYARKRRGNGHPFWWAGFVFVGDPGDGKH